MKIWKHENAVLLLSLTIVDARLNYELFQRKSLCFIFMKNVRSFVPANNLNDINNKKEKGKKGKRLRVHAACFRFNAFNSKQS